MPETSKDRRTACAGADGSGCAGCAGCDTPDRNAEPERVIFTEEMRKTYTILMPTMLPRHFRIVSRVFARFGYKTEPLEIGLHGDSRPVIDAGLKYVHNDACYPAILIVGQFIAALESGQYDPHKVALLLTQTGGGCRASNYIALLRKALIWAGYAYVPVISLNTVGADARLQNHAPLAAQRTVRHPVRRSHHAPAQSVPPLRNRSRHGRGTRGRVEHPSGGGDDLRTPALP